MSELCRRFGCGHPLEDHKEVERDGAYHIYGSIRWCKVMVKECTVALDEPSLIPVVCACPNFSSVPLCSHGGNSGSYHGRRCPDLREGV